MEKVVLITGGSSGIGRECALELAANGCRVYEMSRRETEVGGAQHITGDVTSLEDCRRAVGEIVGRDGRLDILVNSAGMGISGSAEFTESAAAERQIRVNFHGTANMCAAALDALRESRGRIVNLSSVAAVTPLPFQSFYSASKAAINAYTMALANEVRPYGVSVCAVMPGDVATGFTDARIKSGDEGVYSERVARSVGKMEKDERGGMSAEYVGRYVAKIALQRRVKPLYVTRFDYKAISVLAKVLPCQTANWMIGKLYAK